MTRIERALIDEIATDIYLSDCSTEDFKKDVAELIAAYSDNGVIDRAIELLQSVRTTK